MRRMQWVILCCLILMGTAAWAGGSPVEGKVTLSDADQKSGAKATMILEKGTKALSREQREALAANPWIDSSSEPLAVVTFKATDKSGRAATLPLDLASTASLLVPFSDAPGVRKADLDAFLWDPAGRMWRLAGCDFAKSDLGDCQIKSATQVYPALNALRAKTSRLSTLVVVKKRSGAGPVASVSEPAKKVKEANLVSGVEVTGNKDFLFIRTAGLEMALHKPTGMIYKYRVLTGQPMDFTPEGLGGLMVYLVNRSRGEAGLFDVCKSIDFSREQFQGEDYLVIDVALEAGSDAIAPVATAHLQYRISPAMAFIKTDMKFLKDDPSLFELGVVQRYNPLDWTSQMFPTIAETVERPVQKRCFSRYSDLEEDRTKDETEAERFIAENNPESSMRSFTHRFETSEKPEAIRQAGMPWSIIEGDAYYMMYGYLDLATVMVASPNRLKGLPSLTLMPQGVKAGKTYTFDTFMRFFPKPENTITDVCKWYAINRYSTDPLSKEYTKYPAQDPKKRPIGKGFFMGDKTAMGLGHAYSFDEQYLTQGQWYEFPPTQTDVVTTYSAEALAADYAKAKSEGKFIYPYTRQIHYRYDYNEDKPPYTRWMLLSKHGYPFSYYFGPEPIEEQIKKVPQLAPSTAKLLGRTPPIETAVLEVHDDFCNPEYIDWYVKQHNDYLDHYGIDGFYFDMGWDTHVCPCWRHPASGVFHGELKAVAQITNHGRERNPANRFFMNQNIHSPCMYFIDAAFLNEGGVATNRLAIDSIKFNRTSFSNLIYSGQWELAYGKERAAEMITECAMRNLSYGVFPSDPKPVGDPKVHHDFLDFCSNANPLALVYEDDALVLIPRDREISGTMWADEANAMVAVYNNSSEPQPVQIMVNRSILKKYGFTMAPSWTFKLAGTKGSVPGGDGFKAVPAGEDWVKIEGVLPAATMVLAQ